MTQTNKVDASLPLVFGLLVCGESLVFAAAASGAMGAWPALGVHCALSTAVIGWLSRRRHVEDWSLWSIGMLAVFLAGPIGALGVLGLTASLKFASLSGDVLNEWYKRVSGQISADAASLIHDAILTDRAIKPRSDGFSQFLNLMRNGSLSEKQALLGLIGLKYHDDYFPVLGMALRSPEASVRAQAAAVFVKLKEQFKSRLDQALDEAGRRAGDDASSETMVWLAGEILTCAQSGFIDVSQARDGRKVAKSLCKAALVAGGEPELAHGLLCRVLAADGEHEELVERLAPHGQTLAPEQRTMLANSLMALGRYSELRLLVRPTNADERFAPG
jgi:hypothetical protein